MNIAAKLSEEISTKSLSLFQCSRAKRQGILSANFTPKAFADISAFDFWRNTNVPNIAPTILRRQHGWMDGWMDGWMAHKLGSHQPRLPWNTVR